MAIPSPLHPWLRRILGFIAGGRLTHHGCLSTLRFRSKRSQTYGFFQTPPRGSRLPSGSWLAWYSRPVPLPHQLRVPFVRVPGQD